MTTRRMSPSDGGGQYTLLEDLKHADASGRNNGSKLLELFKPPAGAWYCTRRKEVPFGKENPSYDPTVPPSGCKDTHRQDAGCKLVVLA